MYCVQHVNLFVKQQLWLAHLAEHSNSWEKFPFDLIQLMLTNLFSVQFSTQDSQTITR